MDEAQVKKLVEDARARVEEQLEAMTAMRGEGYAHCVRSMTWSVQICAVSSIIVRNMAGHDIQSEQVRQIVAPIVDITTKLMREIISREGHQELVDDIGRDGDRLAKTLMVPVK